MSRRASRTTGWMRLPTTAPGSQVPFPVRILHHTVSVHIAFVSAPPHAVARRALACSIRPLVLPSGCVEGDDVWYTADMRRKAELYLRIGLFRKAAEAAIAAQDLEILAGIRHKCTNPADMAVIDNLISQSGLT